MSANAMRWDGRPGHYEVWYLTLTDRPTATGVWIRYTLRAATDGTQPECALWLVAMTGDGERYARKDTFPASELETSTDPFRLRLGGADLSDRGAAGAAGDGAWELSWEPRLAAFEHVHPVVRRARVASTELVLPHGDLAVSGTVRLGPTRTIELDGARGGQAHLWGTRHAERWAWAHCNDFRSAEGEPRPDTLVDAVAVHVARLGRAIGPSAPVVGRFRGEDFAATHPIALARARSRATLDAWRFEARDGKRRIVADVDAPRGSLVGATYHDPDGRPAYCYNSEVAAMRLTVWDRVRGRPGWTLRDALVADGTAHFESGRRAPVDGVDLLLP